MQTTTRPIRNSISSCAPLVNMTWILNVATNVTPQILNFLQSFQILFNSFPFTKLISICYSQWCGLGGNSLGCATVELAKLLNAADEGLIQRGTRFEFIWLSINLCNLSFTLLTHVRSLSHSSSKALSATGS